MAAQDASEYFDAIDTDGDGSLTLSEMKAHLSDAMSPTAIARLFESLDTNDDNLISRAEFQQGFTLSESVGLRLALGLAPSESGQAGASPSQDARMELADELFATIDCDQNGEISSRELREHLERMASYSLRTIDSIMQVLDVNCDGKLDQAGTSCLKVLPKQHRPTPPCSCYLL